MTRHLSRNRRLPSLYQRVTLLLSLVVTLLIVATATVLLVLWGK